MQTISQRLFYVKDYIYTYTTGITYILGRILNDFDKVIFLLF